MLTLHPHQRAVGMVGTAIEVTHLAPTVGTAIGEDTLTPEHGCMDGVDGVGAGSAFGVAPALVESADSGTCDAPASHRQTI